MGIASLVALGVLGASVTDSQSESPADSDHHLPEELRDFGPSPFEFGRTLRAHDLRGLRPTVINQILTAPDGGEIALSTLALALQTESEEARVLLFVEIDGADLLRSNQTAVPRLELYVYAVGPAQQIAGHRAQVFALDVGTFGEAVWQNGLKLYSSLDLPPGDYRLRVLVRNFHSGAKGLQEVTLSVPILSDSTPRLLPPLIPGPSGRDPWLPVDGWPRTVRHAAWPYPFVIESQALDPATFPVLVAGMPTRAFLIGYQIPTGKLQAAVRLTRAGSNETPLVTANSIEIVGRHTFGSSGLVALELRFTPPPLEAGRYRLAVALAPESTSESESPDLPVLLVHGDRREMELLWCDLPSLVDPPAPATQQPEVTRAGDSESDPRDKIQLGRAARRIARHYREVLRLLDESSPQEARMALVELESSALGGKKSMGLTRLRTVELATAKELAERSPEALLPISMLHAEASRLYLARRLFSLGFNARAMVELLAEHYVELGGSPTITANMLASLAGDLQSANLLASSHRLYFRALQHDPNSVAALLGLAASFEKYGSYSEAIDYLELLVAAAPELEEGLLRLAINLARVGRTQRAEKLLEEIIERDSGSWICAIAYQQLAWKYLQDDNAPGAAELLATAIERMPQSQGNRVLLAHIFDRLGSPQNSLEQLTLVTPPKGPSRSSERFTYDTWPRQVLERTRQDLSKRAEAATAVLARALAGEPVREGS